MGVQREVEVGLQRRLRRELQVDPLIICLVQPAPAGTPAYKGRADAEPDTRPAPRGGRRDGGGRQAPAAVPQRQLVTAAAAAAPAATMAAPAPAPAAVVAKAPPEEPEPTGRVRRRRSAASAG